MLLYRVFPYLSGASAGQPGHPLYIHPAHGTGRFDNRSHYLAWYMAAEAVSAVGESFAHLSSWGDEMVEFPQIPGSRKALGIYDLPDDLRYVDLDDPQRLVDLGVRPSQAIARNRPYTQAPRAQDPRGGEVQRYSLVVVSPSAMARVLPLGDRPEDRPDRCSGGRHRAVDSAARTLAKTIV
jgi:hypothetical protein